MIRGWVQIGPLRKANRPIKSARALPRTRAAHTLIVMARAPGFGVGKTRLAAEIGRCAALRINRALQARTLRALRGGPWNLLLCVTPDRAVRARLSGVWPADIPRIAQGGGDLGARLARAVKRRRRVALVGTDCPAMSRAHAAAAFRALGRHRVALGPSPDGGFWIVAARSGREAAAAMAGVRWSSADALNDVLGRLTHMPARLAELADVDTREDLRRVRPFLHRGGRTPPVILRQAQDDTLPIEGRDLRRG